MLLLDEPFGALDAQVRAELREWLRRLHEEIHVTTIFVTHDQEEAMEVAEQIVVMNEGRIEQVGAPRELYEQPAQRVRDVLRRPRQPPRRRVRAPARHPDPGTSDEDRRTEALVERVVHLGFEVRVELTLHDGRDVWAQVTREQAQQLELEEGQILAVRRLRRASAQCSPGLLRRLSDLSGSRVPGVLVARQRGDRPGSLPAAMSATVTRSSTLRRLARSAIQTCCSDSAEPTYSISSGAGRARRRAAPRRRG